MNKETVFGTLGLVAGIGGHFWIQKNRSSYAYQEIDYFLPVITTLSLVSLLRGLKSDKKEKIKDSIVSGIKDAKDIVKDVVEEVTPAE